MDKDYPYDDLVLRSPLPMPLNMPLDEKIENLVRIMRHAGIETDQSCQGGEGHAYPYPMVRFNGGKTEGLRALDIVLSWGFKVRQLNRAWYIVNGEIVGPQWEIILHSVEQGD